MTPVQDPTNAAQRDYWNTGAGPTWAALQSLLDRQIDGLGRSAMDALTLAPGHNVLDIGCGCGQTSLQLAERVGRTGTVTGIDISRPMLDVARQRERPAGAGAVEFIEADAQDAPLGDAAFDHLYSRFGVMFFADPAVAFANLARALRPGGQIAFVCWRSMTENTWMSAPSRAVAHLLPPAAPSDPLAPGPFAFADPGRVRSMLAAAGLADISVSPLDALIGAGSLENQVTLAFRVGPLGAALRENPGLEDRMTDAVRDALLPYVTASGEVLMPAACWIATAGKP